MKRVWFIVNPISGTHSKDDIVEMIPRYLTADSFITEVYYTGHRGHAAEIAGNAVREHIDIVVAVGGDGTVNETARALIHTDVALGIVPCGSGNGLARHLFLPMDPEGALQVIAECNIKSLDYGLINGQPFFCTAGVGFDAFLSDKFNKSNHRGLLSYIENALKEGLNYHPETYELTINDDAEAAERHQIYKAFLITCANASQYGNDFFIAPHASMKDGLMDVTIMEPFNVLEAGQIAYQLVNRTIDKNSRIKTFRCRSVTIHRQNPGVIHFDGDPKKEQADVHVELVPGDIRMVTNPNKQPWQPPLLKAFKELYSDIDTQIRETPRRIGRINQELLNLLNR